MNSIEQQAALTARELANFLDRGELRITDLQGFEFLQRQLDRQCAKAIEGALERNPEARAALIEAASVSLKDAHD